MNQKANINTDNLTTINTHSLDDFPCVIICESWKYDIDIKESIKYILELSDDLTEQYDKLYILMNGINTIRGNYRGIYPIDFNYCTWEQVLNKMFNTTELEQFTIIFKSNGSYKAKEEYIFN